MTSRWQGTVPGALRSAIDASTFSVASRDMLSADASKRNYVLYLLAKMIHYGGTSIQGLDIVRLSGVITECFERYPKPSAERNYLVAELLTHAKIAEKLVGSPELHCRYDWIRNDLEALVRVYDIDCERAARVGALLHLGIRELDGDDREPTPPATCRPWGPARTALPKLRKCEACGLFGYWTRCKSPRLVQFTCNSCS